MSLLFLLLSHLKMLKSFQNFVRLLIYLHVEIIFLFATGRTLLQLLLQLFIKRCIDLGILSNK